MPFLFCVFDRVGQSDPGPSFLDLARPSKPRLRAMYRNAISDQKSARGPKAVFTRYV